MRIFDVTLPMHDAMVVYHGDPPFSRCVASSLETGASSEVSILAMGSHTGTHVDVPAHMLRGGARLDDIPLDCLVGPVRVIDLRRIPGHIEARHLRRLVRKGVKRVLFRTKNSARWKILRAFDAGFVALSGDAAEFLVEKGVRLVGVDGLSVDRAGSGTHPAHRALLGAGIVVVEGLNLDGVPAGRYQLFCGPLRVARGDGAPARVLLHRSRSKA